jgi:hypothetical protein
VNDASAELKGSYWAIVVGQLFYKLHNLMKNKAIVLTSSFLLYMPVFRGSGGKVALYRPLQAPSVGKVLYRPLEELQCAVK